MPAIPIRPALLLAAAALAIAAEPAPPAKPVEVFESAPWGPDLYDTMPSTHALVAEVPPDLAGISTRSLAWTVHFSGKGFGAAQAKPPAPIRVPGKLRQVSIRYRGDGSDYGLTMLFSDGLGRGEVERRKLEWNLGSAKTREWTTATFAIPDAWTQPISINGIITSNWYSKDRKASVTVLLDQLEVATDLSPLDLATGAWKDWQEDPAKRPAPAALRAATVASGVEAEVFAGRQPGYTLSLRSWLPERQRGRLTWRLFDRDDGIDGRQLGDGAEDFEVDGLLLRPIALPRLPFGTYRLAADVAWRDGARIGASVVMAVVPRPLDLDPAQLDGSPWGIDTHGGREQVLQACAAIGVRWFRDFAWNFKWMQRAKGAGDFAGWPWYPKMLARYQAVGGRVLPVLGDGITPPGTEAGEQPAPAWRRDIAAILAAFPGVAAWELDNEYEGSWKPNDRKERAGNYENYRRHHQAFGELVAAVTGRTALAVEQGTAGIRPDLSAAGIASGQWDGIDVLNGHHYCGIDPPELNAFNENTGGDAGEPILFLDRVRELTAQAGSGRPRQAWITEFGWDTRAGKVVSERQQAAYLQRGLLGVVSAGMDRVFWYWDLDGQEATTFFGGCGLFTCEPQPKPAAAAYAGLAWMLANPRFRGELDAGPGTTGLLFADRGRLVAALWTIEDVQGPEVAFASGELHDWKGNPIPGRTARLGLHPTWCLGVAADDRWARQAAWAMRNRRLLTVAAGDPLALRLRVANPDAGAQPAAAGLELPAGWTGSAAWTGAVAGGGAAAVELRVAVPPDARQGEYEVAAAVALGGAERHRLRARVLVQPPLSVAVAPLGSVPGAGLVEAVVSNRSGRALAGSLAISLPRGWSTPAATVPVPAIAPGGTATVQVPVAWASGWGADESASIAVSAPGSDAVRVPLVPGACAIPRLDRPVFDGDFAEWPANAVLPDWMLTMDRPAQAVVRLAWNPEGLLFGLAVRDSRVVNSQPDWFWAQDALEFFVSSATDLGPASTWGGRERQIYLVPQPAEHRAFTGVWKRADEIAQAVTLIPGVRSAAAARDGGYVLEALIPAAALAGVELRPGAAIASMFSLAIRGQRMDRQVGWPVAKSAWQVDRPATWGRLVLLP